MGFPIGDFEGGQALELQDTRSTPPTITFNIDGADLLVIHKGGRIELMPNVDLDDASRAFWRCVVATAEQRGLDVVWGTQEADA